MNRKVVVYNRTPKVVKIIRCGIPRAYEGRVAERIISVLRIKTARLESAPIPDNRAFLVIPNY